MGLFAEELHAADFTPGGLDSLLIDFTGMTLSPGAVLTLTVDHPVPLDCALPPQTLLLKSLSLSGK